MLKTEVISEGITESHQNIFILLQTKLKKDDLDESQDEDDDELEQAKKKDEDFGCQDY